MRHLPLCCLLLLATACLVPAVPAFGEDAPAAEAKTAAFADVAAAWPAPSKDSAFTVDLVAVMGESPVGSYLIEVGPAVVEGKVVGWRVHERLALSFGPREMVGDSVYRFTADFRPIDGESAENFQGTPVRTTWRAADGKITITETPEGGEAKTRTVEVAAGLAPGKVGMFMAARFMPAAAATVRGRDFSATDEDEMVSPFRITVEPQARHEGQQVLGFDGQRGTKRIQLKVDPKTREILHGLMTEDGSPMRMALVPKAAAPAKDDLFAREPKTAAEGSAHALYAITVKDKALIEKAFRWTTMYEVTKQKLEAAKKEAPSFEDYKKTALENFSAGEMPPNVTPGQVKAGLQMFVSQVQSQELPQGWTAILWPESFGKLFVVMEKKDDGWKAIGVRKLQ